EQFVVGALRIRAQLLLTELDQERPQLLLAIAIDPVWIPLVPQAPELLCSPHLLGHASPPLESALAAIVCPARVLRPGIRARRRRVYRRGGKALHSERLERRHRRAENLGCRQLSEGEQLETVVGVEDRVDAVADKPGNRIRVGREAGLRGE